jgi:hypothetical protein
MPALPALTRCVPLLAGLLLVAACGAGGSGSATPERPSHSVAGPAPGGGPAPHAPAGRHHGLIRISAVGDTELGNTPDLPPDPAGYLDAVKTKLAWKAQIVFGNLEGTLTDATGSKCGAGNGGNCFAFRTPPSYARYLHDAGFTLLNDANNHSHDYGQAGLDQTINAIHREHMQQTGLPGEITIVHADHEKVAFVAFAPYSNTADLLELPAAGRLIDRARRRAKVVVVYMHTGAEGSNADHVTGDEEYYDGEDRGNPEKFAHLAIREGASLVIASGPHVVRGMQFYHHRLIAYSLGNFANFHNFGSGGDLADSAILHVSLTSNGHFHSAHLFAVSLDSGGHPTLGGGTVSFVQQLSNEDFGRSGAHVHADGTITPP